MPRPAHQPLWDEITDVINQPLIEILNKGAEGGIYTTCAMQTLADLARRLGSEEAARMALGNLNNLIALRSKDRPTQDFIVETFGKTAIHHRRLHRHPRRRASARFLQQRVSLRETREETVPSDILGKLPNLQYFALVSGGRLLKGRVPILASDPADQEAPAARSAA
jgi:conjugal transfer pilus assembly protein TraD